MKNYLRYIYAIFAVPLAIFLRFALVPLIGYGIPYIMLFPVTVGVALLAGLGPAVLTGLFGAIVTDYFFIPPLHTITMDIAHVTRASIMVLTSIFVGYIGNALKVARAKAEKQALSFQESEGRLKRAQEIAHLGSWELDLVNNRLSWSDEVYRIFGLRPQEFVATYEAFLEAVHPDDRAAVSAAYSGSLREGRDTYEIEHRVVRKSTGEIRYVHEKCQHVRDETGRTIRSVGMVHDITGRRRAEEDLKKAFSKLERSNKELEQFAYVASHDLQEPLRMVASYVKLLEKKYGGQLDEKADQYIHFAVDGALRMQKLIEGLLAYSRIERGGEFTPVDTNEVFSQAVSNLSAALQESHAVITKDDLPGVSCDETQFMQLFQNLLGNAVKFRKPEVPPLVHVSAKREGGEWVFSVRDNGIGLDPAYANRIFLIFQRLHTREEYPGTGIGLALCKKIVERHHGRIWVESVPDEGATFFFTIPG